MPFTTIILIVGTDIVCTCITARSSEVSSAIESFHQCVVEEAAELSLAIHTLPDVEELIDSVEDVDLMLLHGTPAVLRQAGSSTP